MRRNHRVPFGNGKTRKPKNILLNNNKENFYGIILQILRHGP